MELPIRCSNCNRENMVDLERLEIRPISKLFFVEEFVCQHCGCKKPCWFTTRQFEAELKRLEEMRPSHSSFAYHLAKAVKRAQEIQIRGERLYGEIGHQDMVAT